MKAVIENRIKELSEKELKALSELDGLAVGTFERQLKWDFIRELGCRKSELKYLLILINDSSAKICLCCNQSTSEVEPKDPF